MAKQRRDVWICDSPDCDTEVLADEDAPLGYSGRVSTEGGTGCVNEPWFACKSEHIRGAVESVAQAAQEKAWNS
jgi:hypothetical protein